VGYEVVFSNERFGAASHVAEEGPMVVLWQSSVIMLLTWDRR
jgi:hypothetical protein